MHQDRQEGMEDGSIGEGGVQEREIKCFGQNEHGVVVEEVILQQGKSLYGPALKTMVLYMMGMVHGA